MPGRWRARHAHPVSDPRSVNSRQAAGSSAARSSCAPSTGSARGSHHQAYSFCSLHPSRRNHLADDASDAFAPNVDLKPCSRDGNAPDEKLNNPSLFGREQPCPERAEFKQCRDGVGFRNYLHLTSDQVDAGTPTGGAQKFPPGSFLQNEFVQGEVGHSLTQSLILFLEPLEF